MMIDIVIPIYNVKDYICECLDSFINQYDGTFSLILINDGSTDGVQSIIDDYSSKYPFIVSHYKSNGGSSSARNFGLSFCNGQYLWFFDSDDYVSDCAIKQIKEKISKEHADIIFIEDSRFVDGEKKEKYIKSNLSERIFATRNKKKILTNLLRQKRMRVAAWSMIINRQSPCFSNLTFVEGLASEDVEWASKVVSSANTYSFIKGPIYKYRIRSNSLSHSDISDWKMTSIMNTILKDSSKKRENYQWYINGFLSVFYLQFIYYFSKNKKIQNAKYRDFIFQNKWLLKYGKNAKTKLANFIVSIFGIRFFLFIVGVIYK